MTRDEFRRVVEAFRRGAKPGRNLYIWEGSAEAARTALSGMSLGEVDLVRVLPEPEACPRPESEARRLLSGRIEQVLERLREELSLPCAVLVRSPGLILRYGVGLGPFYSFVGDRRLAAVVVEDTAATASLQRLPPGVEYDGDRILSGLVPLVQPGYVVKGDPS